MTKTCVVCKKQPIPYDRSRSFHKFPDNSVLKEKWISALKLSCNITKNSRICSDHFRPESFHQTDGYTFLKKLLPDAMPSAELKRKDLSDISNKILTNVDDRDNYEMNNENNFFEESLNENVSVTEIEGCVDTNGALKRKFPETSIEHLHHSAAKKAKIQNESGKSDEHHGTIDASDNEQFIEHMRSESGTASAEVSKLKRKRSNSKTETCTTRTSVRFRVGFKTKYISRTDFTTDEAWNRFLEFTSYKNAQIKASQKRNLRKKNKINNFKDLVQTFKKKETLAVADYLQGLPENIKQLITRMKEKKRTAPFPSHLKTFARTLHFHSPAAYQMVRNTFLKCLPCVETLNSWNNSKNYKPGICEEIVDHVSELVKNGNKIGKSSIFNVTFDEMNIKQWAYYCKKSHEWKGLVDLGGQLEEIEKKENVKASKALVFMLVNINGGFKTPVAYYFTNSLSGSDKSILLKDLLITLHKKSIKVVSVTFDGDETNQKACKFLGANFNYTDKEHFKPFFDHPASSEQVFVFFDPCHMLKLVRNYFAIKGPIIYDSQYIDWSYIKKLNEKQYEEQLHCACKIKNRHVNFHNEKMKVFLAAQVLSSSTATALHFLEHELKDENFKNSSATSTFCKNFNDIFDILNTKNKFCKSPDRKCLTENNLSDLKSKIDEFINYIEKLEINVLVKINSKVNKLKINTFNKENQTGNFNHQYKTVRKFVIEAKSVRTGFTGFIICLTNLYSLCENLFKNKIVDYFLSYKISQDHVEMFFALIRRMNGYTTNPTTIQFQSAFKKLLLNNINVTVPASANCTPQDKTLIISDDDFNESNRENKCKSDHRIKKSHAAKDSFPIGNFLHNNAIIFEHDYSRNEGWAESEYLDQIIRHTAGSVVYSIKKIIHCTDCLDMIGSSNNVSSKSRLTELKNRGGLQFASDDVNFICLCAEKVLRKFKDSLLAKNIYFTVVSETLKMLPSSVLDFNNHVLDQDPLYDHRQQLIYLIVQNYVDKRLKHESDKLGDIKYRTRMYYNKLTIFKGE